VVSIFAVLALLNPSEKMHREAEQAYIIKAHSDNLIPYEQAKVERIIYHNFIIFSFTIDDGTKCLFGSSVSTIGICGKVFVMPEPEGYG